MDIAAVQSEAQCQIDLSRVKNFDHLLKSVNCQGNPDLDFVLIFFQSGVIVWPRYLKLSICSRYSTSTFLLHLEYDHGLFLFKIHVETFEFTFTFNFVYGLLKVLFIDIHQCCITSAQRRLLMFLPPTVVPGIKLKSLNIISVYILNKRGIVCTLGELPFELRQIQRHHSLPLRLLSGTSRDLQ